jgi:hypothetical protein
MGELPMNAAAVVASLNAASTNGSTPTAGALNGVTTYCANYMGANPDDVCVGVLISDGEPTRCDPQDATGLGNIAQAALTQSGVRTFTVGMAEADFAVLNAIARAGDGDCDPASPEFACDATAVRDALIAALQAIRESITTTEIVKTPLPCEWEIPDPPDGESFDRNLVNVQFQQGALEPQRVGHVASENDCSNFSGGWYYDDPNAPNRVLVCPDTCAVLQSIEDARVDILFGCASIPSIAR